MATIERTVPTTTQEDNPLERVLTRVYTLNWEVALYVVIFVAAILTRFWDLGTRVMSHDESLHTYYSWELYDSGQFDHTPLMHGPLLFHAVAFSYFLFGPNDFSARLYPALLGIAIVMFPILFRRWLGRAGALVASVGLLISPMLLYYSRYIRHDIPTILFAMIMLYALLQYVDGERPRRPVWIAVLAGAMLLMLASKEVGFIYIAIFGSFLTLYWILRMIQDWDWFRVERQVQLSDQPDDHDVVTPGTEALAGPAFAGGAPLWLWGVGQIFTLGASVVLGYLTGAIYYEFYRTDAGFLPDDISVRVFQLIFIIVFGLLLQSIGFVRTFSAAGRPERGLPGMVAHALYANMRSTLMLVSVGAILGGVIALWFMSVLYLIKPGTIFVVESQFGQPTGVITLNETELMHFIQWAFVPIGLLVFVVALLAAVKRASWQDVVAFLLIATMVAGVLVYFERHSHPPDEGIAGQTFAADPAADDADAAASEEDNTFIWLAWLFCGIVTAGVLVTRLMTNIWEFMNRQPIFDMLIVMGTLIFPWLAAFPLFWAGYVLDEAPLPRETIQAAIVAAIPFLMVSIVVGLSWNWRIWPLAVAVFGGLFVVFFTTFFTNGDGVGTGLIGSLGYWLEQQDVRRGSQPQYYYLLVQLPVYEFLPMILAGLAGFVGLSRFYDHRHASRLARVDRLSQPHHAQGTDERFEALQQDGLPDSPDTEQVADDAPDVVPYTVSSTYVEDEYLDDSDELARGWGYDSAMVLPVWAQPSDPEEERSRAERAPFEYLGGVPFLQLLGYWTIMILVGLSIAGEKMPWLTTHLTVPMILVGGWYTGQVIERLNWQAIRRSGWILLLFVLPVFFIALAEAMLPYLTGSDLPFQGQQQHQLTATGRWIAAAFAVVVTGYFLLRLSLEVGWAQARRLYFVAAVILLAGLTARAAWMFSFINYDHPTEFGVYAHSGPVVKDILVDLQDFAARHPEGDNVHIVYDDQSSWPMLWYLRDFEDKRYIYGEADQVAEQAGQIEGALAVIVGNKKNAEIERLLGNDYYRIEGFRLWWPMQEYFNLNYGRITRIFEPDMENPPASLYREGIWNIWWSRDYNTYAQAMCVEERVIPSNTNPNNTQGGECYAPEQLSLPPEERDLDQACVQRVVRECEQSADRFNLERWPVSDEIYFYVRKDFAAQIWDVGLEGQSVAQRLIPDPEDQVQAELTALQSFGSGTLTNPRDLATDAAGNLYVADTGQNRVLVFTPDGTVLREIGSGMLNEPWGIAISPVDGNVYVADTWNHRVVVFTPEGEMVTAFGQFGRPTDGVPNAMYGPRDVDVDREGNVYVADTGGHRIRVFGPDFQFLRDIAADGQGLQNEPEPVGVQVHPISGEVYIAETWNQQVSVFRRDGTFANAWDVNMWAGTRNSVHRPFIAISPDGTLILVSDMDASDSNNGPRVVAYDLAGNAIISFNAPMILTTGDAGPLGVEAVGGIAFGPDGRIYVADAATSRIVVFPPLGLSGNLMPVPDPAYGAEAIGGTGGDADDVNAVETVGFAYWQALSRGDYRLYQSLFCAEDLEAADFPQTEAAFLNTVASPYVGASLRDLLVQPEVQDDTAVVRWGGALVFAPGTERESRAAAANYGELPLVKRADVWRICRNPTASPDIFRPGGG
ncbi:MAG: TIGR03663 family protein [Chloroflexi bacterium]|nr:TIGR03663 family protein [Chloroflexota bacterium]